MMRAKMQIYLGGQKVNFSGNNFFQKCEAFYNHLEHAPDAPEIGN